MKKFSVPKISLSQRVSDHLIQGIFIFMSVLFALFINNHAESLKTKKQKRIAMESIQQELQSNLKVARDWQEHHLKNLQHTRNLQKTPLDSLPADLFIDGFFNLFQLTKNESLFDDIMTSTAWDTSKSTGIIAEFDYLTAEQITKVYELQNHIIKNTINNVLNLMGDRSTHLNHNVHITLGLFQWHFQELYGQVSLLIVSYEDLLNLLDQNHMIRNTKKSAIR